MILRAGAVDVPSRLHVRGDLDGRLGLLRHARGRATGHGWGQAEAEAMQGPCIGHAKTMQGAIVRRCRATQGHAKDIP